MESFDSWLKSNDSKINELRDAALEPLPDSSNSSLAIEKAIQYAEEAGQLLADVEFYYATVWGQEFMKVKMSLESGNLADFKVSTNKEREALADLEVAGIKRVADSLKVTCRTHNSRLNSLLNARRSRL